MKSIFSNKYFYLITLLLFIENMPFISIFSSIVITGWIIYFYFIKKYELSLVFLFLSSGYVNTNNSIYDLKLFYVLLFILSLLAIKNNDLKVSKSWFFIYIIFFTFFTILGFVFVEFEISAMRFYLRDYSFFIVPVVIYLCYKHINFNILIHYIFIFIVSFVFIKLVLSLSGFGIDNSWYSDYKAIFQDEIEAFFIIFLISLVLFSSYKVKEKLFIISLLSAIGYIIFYYTGLGSQVLILIIFPFIVWAIKHYLKTTLIIIVISIFGLTSINLETNKYLEHKLNNIFSLLEVFDNNIEAIPRSPKVRIIESINITNNDLFIIGTGFGGNFKDSSYPFGSYLNQDDFSDYEISNKTFYAPHNWNYGLLKFGVFYFALALFILYRIIKINDANENKIFFYSLFLFVLFNFGWTYKIAMLAGVLLIYTFRRENDKIVTY